ncbi:AAA family ATPase [Desulfofundulus sp. TPOSR]|jgi:predicted ATPase|uniref:AAA family ATPase n=1 Tax=Desulfofundulus sp. TPOSR TaxID=2714340 RepID=UPI00140C2277|nr:AAA family ATPase [Desulfofundulus sp. TPOSR]NHM27074.1 AAA family ATPase [Desulfofundulus sp. TPOSR]
MFLRAIQFTGKRGAAGKGYPFNIPAFRNVKTISITRPVTFFIGENGTGKSTLLEAVAALCGFHAGGGSRSHSFSYQATESELKEHIRLSWRPKVTDGFFLRAETFYHFASYIDELAKEEPLILKYYGGRSLHEQSHGEAFFALFQHRFDRRGIYLLDEPEAALSPARQIAFLRLLWQMEQTGNAQFLMATHSPILLAYPGATIYSLDYSPLRSVEYEDTEHYRLTRDFLNNRASFFRHLFEG